MTDQSERKYTIEAVQDVPAQPEQPRVEGAGSHRYLDGFLAGERPDDGALLEEESLDDRLLAALRQIYDPEIPVNIYDLGLIYDCTIDDENNVVVTMTLTTPHCPVAESMPGEVESRLSMVEGVQSVKVDLVWDPPWDPSKMTDEAKLELGFM
ncbi:MAG: SUF system Fe-S cluster assembly protein [Alphaproteobacteria bacterium]|nr:MAG: SUF system Fe-S cluster assembly protein [Alphaproteobacteria bacterium]